MLSAQEAIERLREGNRRYVSGRLDGAASAPKQRGEVADGQFPFAIVLGCSDSRVPAELVFDQGLGDLFVIRVAGNIVAPSLIGSAEFAATQFGTRLVLVMGHSRCGAIATTIHEVRNPTPGLSPHLSAIVDKVRPSVEPLLASELAGDADALSAAAVRANVDASVRELREASGLLATLIEQDGLQIVGAEYSLDTGAVEFHDPV